MIPTIPDKIPRQILRNIKKEQYDKVILFTLAVFGSHKLSEFVNDPKNFIKNRMDKIKFLEWTEKLKKKRYIEEYELDDEIYYREARLRC